MEWRPRVDSVRGLSRDRKLPKGLQPACSHATSAIKARPASPLKYFYPRFGTGEFVGILFNGNFQSLSAKVAYYDRGSNAVCVHALAIVEALGALTLALRVLTLCFNWRTRPIGNINCQDAK